MDNARYKLEQLTEGLRVQIHPATDTWMMGDRYGVIVKTGRKYVYVHMDRSGRTKKFLPWMIGEIVWNIMQIDNMPV